MSVNAFLKGVSIGIIAGATVSMVMSSPGNRKKFMRTGAGKALKSFGDVLENISDAIG